MAARKEALDLWREPEAPTSSDRCRGRRRLPPGRAGLRRRVTALAARGSPVSSPSGGMTIGFIGWLLAGLVVAARSMRDMTNVSAARVARAVEDNEAEFLLALGRAGGGRERDDAEITWVIGGSPIAYHNCVVRADLEPERADAAITESQNLMRTSGVAGSWHVGPSMRPTDLGTRLEAHGFEGGPEPGMAADLRALPDVEAPTDVRISRVVTDTGLEAYEQVLSLGFGEGPPEAAWVREMYARIGVGDDVPWRHYVGLAGGDPVACASAFLAAGVAGLYFVCTVPDARRRGIGAAISREALAGTLELGFDVGVLGSSPMGQPMYERLGFREVCAVNVYEWSPFTPPT